MTWGHELQHFRPLNHLKLSKHVDFKNNLLLSSYDSFQLNNNLLKLIRLRVCVGWSEPFLVAHTTLLEISCRGSIIFDVQHMQSWYCKTHIFGGYFNISVKTKKIAKI